MIVAVTVLEGDLGQSLDTIRAEASAESREATRRQVRTFQWVGSRWRREKGEERGDVKQRNGCGGCLSSACRPTSVLQIYGSFRRVRDRPQLLALADFAFSLLEGTVMLSHAGRVSLAGIIGGASAAFLGINLFVVALCIATAGS